MSAVPKRGRGRSRQTVELEAAMFGILREIQPASIRAVCYQLFVAGLIPDMSKNSTAAVSRVLVGARERGVIPWAWVVDETREAEIISAVIPESGQRVQFGSFGIFVAEAYQGRR